MDTIEKQILKTLNKIRPFLQRDGGDVEFVSFVEGTVFVRMNGACADCAMLDVTIADGVEMILIEEVPGVNKVQVVQ